VSYVVQNAMQPVKFGKEVKLYTPVSQSLTAVQMINRHRYLNFIIFNLPVENNVTLSGYT